MQVKHRALSDLVKIEPITEIERISALRRILGLVASRESLIPIVITGSCSPIINTSEAVTESSHKIIAQKNLVTDIFPHRIYGTRELNQGIKRRTVPVVKSANGMEILNYLGDGINGIDEADRTPNPRRLITMAEHARMVIDKMGIDFQEGPNYTAHDLMSPDFERAFLRTDEEGKHYALGGAILWLGYNSKNKVQTPQSEFLATIENVAGIKVGPENTLQYLEDLTNFLNPNGDTNRIIYMFRYANSSRDLEKMEKMIESLVKINDQAIVLYDAHGITESIDNKKTRRIEQFKIGIDNLAKTCQKHGLRLNGINLEASGLEQEEYYECIDDSERKPNGKARIDPELNNEQLSRVLVHLNTAMTRRY